MPLFTTNPTSPLIDRFIREIAILRSPSFKKRVISGRSGRNAKATSPNNTAGIPYARHRILTSEKVKIRERDLIHLDDEKKPPICDGGIRVLNAERDQTTECTSDRSKAEPISHTQSHFMFRVEKSCVIAVNNQPLSASGTTATERTQVYRNARSETSLKDS